MEYRADNLHRLFWKNQTGDQFLLIIETNWDLEIISLHIDEGLNSCEVAIEGVRFINWGLDLADEYFFVNQVLFEE